MAKILSDEELYALLHLSIDNIEKRYLLGENFMATIAAFGDAEGRLGAQRDVRGLQSHRVCGQVHVDVLGDALERHRDDARLVA